MALLPDPGPVRALTYAVLLRTVGRGLFLTVSVLYFKNSVGLSGAEIGLGLSIAAVVGLAGGLPAGRLSDVIGPRGVSIGFATLTAVLVCGYAFVTGFAGFAVVAALVSFSEAAESAARGTLIGGAVPPAKRVEARAYLRAVTNVGWSIGGLAAGVALTYDTRPAYLAMLYGCAACYLAGALLTLRVPPVAPAPKPEDGEPTWAVLRDRPYAVLTLLNAVLMIHGGIQLVAIPLWIGHLGAPTEMIAVLGLVNTVTVTLLQVRFSRGTGDVTGAARAQRRSGVLLMACCVLFALSSGRPGWLMITLLVLGAFMLVFGELLQAAGSWGLSYELAPAHAIGQYQGLYGTSYQIANIAAPAVLGLLVGGTGWLGWLLFGGVFVLAGLAVPPVTRWAERTRTAPALVPA